MPAAAICFDVPLAPGSDLVIPDIEGEAHFDLRTHEVTEIEIHAYDSEARTWTTVGLKSSDWLWPHALAAAEKWAAENADTIDTQAGQEADWARVDRAIDRAWEAV